MIKIAHVKDNKVYLAGRHTLHFFEQSHIVHNNGKKLRTISEKLFSYAIQMLVLLIRSLNNSISTNSQVYFYFITLRLTHACI